MASAFGPEAPGSVLDATKDPSTACSVVRARKIRDCENPMADREQYNMGVASGENYPLLSETYKNCGCRDR